MESDRLRLSVIIPMYNVAQWLPTCLKSIANQTLPSRDFEVIMVDDASTDGTVEISREFCSRYANFRCIELKEHTPGGPSIPANIALDQAQGEYVSVVESDDFIEPDMFDRLLRRAQETRADMIFFSYRVYYEQEQRYAPAPDEEALHRLCRAELAGAPLRELQQKALLVSVVPWCKIYHRKFLDQFHIRYPEGDFFGEDNVLHWYSIVQSRSIATVDRWLYNYRHGRPGQATAGHDSRLLVIHDHARRIQEFLISKHCYEDFRTDFFCWYVNTSRWLLPRTKSCRKDYLRRLQAFCQKDVDWAQLQACRRVGGWSIGTMLQCWFMLHDFWQTGRLVGWCVIQAGRLLRSLRKNVLRREKTSPEQKLPG